MIQYFSGAVSKEVLESRREDLAILLTPNTGNRPDLSNTTWAADNGCFTQPHTYSDERYLSWLAERPASTCVFATAPDVVGDAVATLNRSLPVLRKIRALGYPAALVAQDGLEKCFIPWSTFDVLFVGGSTEWKLSPAAERIVREAKRRGKWVHLGRVNSRKRLALAESWGCDSADGTYLAFGPKVNFPKLIGWLDDVNGTREEVAA